MDLSSIFSFMLLLSIMGTVVAGLILTLKALFKHTFSPGWHYYIWIILVIRLLIPYSLESSLSIFNLFPFPQTFETIKNETALPSAMQTAAVELHGPHKADTTAVNLETDDTYTKTGTVNSTGDSLTFTYIAAIWLLGVTALSFYFLIVYLKFYWRLSRRLRCKDSIVLDILEECKAILNIKRDIPLLFAPGLNTSFVFGLLKPKLVVSPLIMNRLSSAENKYVFLHELVHVKQNDILVIWLTTALQVLHWFNPVIWYAFYRMRSDCETACDAYVLSYLKPAEHKKYGETLINLLSIVSNFHCSIIGNTGIGSSKKNVRNRVRRIALFQKKRSYAGYFGLTEGNNLPYINGTQENELKVQLYEQVNSLIEKQYQHYRLLGKDISPESFFVAENKVMAEYSISANYVLDIDSLSEMPEGYGKVS